MKHIIPFGHPVPKFKDYKGAIKSAGTDRNGKIILLTIILLLFSLIGFLFKEIYI